MLFTMKHLSRAMLFMSVVHLALTAHSKSSKSIDTTQAPTTTPHPTTIKLQQLKNMEESALKGWYDMVNNFLVIIKPDHKTIDYIFEFLNGKPDLDVKATVLEIAKLNYAFLTMIIIGIVYVCVMLVPGLFFFCCRFCGRCGAKNSQRQRRSDNCWRTMHKFCLILMIAFLVVPITCMWIINQHIKDSSGGVKGNATEVFNILTEFANETDKDLDEKLQSPLISPLQNFDSFKDHFVDLVHENISNSIDHAKLEEIKNIVTWVLSIEDQQTEIANASALSEAVKDLESRIKDIRKQTKNLKCSDNRKKICNLDLMQLPIEKINVDGASVDVQTEFQKLLKINFEELRNIIDKIQNNSILRSKIEEESESLKRFAEDANPDEERAFESVRKELKSYTQKLRSFAYYGKRDVTSYLRVADEYEDYRWYTMFGIAGVLFIPVALLSLGLVCGCCGYEKDRHPTKRSTSSHCGGVCLIAGVYIFFLVSSVLMLITIFLFVVGGSMQSFVCFPLYQENFEVLDQIKEKHGDFSSTIFQNVTPSKLLKDCEEDKSIIIALGLFNESDTQSYAKLFSNPAIANSINTEEIDNKLNTAILEITTNIRKKLEQFTTALNLTDMKDIPLKLQESLKSSKANLSHFIDEVTAALDEETGGNVETLQFVNESAAKLFEFIDDFEKKLNNFSAPLINIYNEADKYKDKIKEIEQSLDKVEEKLPKVVKAHLFQAVASSSGYTDTIKDIGRCYKVWISFDIARTAVCEFVVYPLNGFWFGLGWALIFIIPTIFFSVKLSRYYLRMKYDDDPYLQNKEIKVKNEILMNLSHDSGEAVPLEDMSRTKPFSYTNPGPINWMHQFSPHQNYMVHPTSNQARQFHYK